MNSPFMARNQGSTFSSEVLVSNLIQFLIFHISHILKSVEKKKEILSILYLNIEFSNEAIQIILGENYAHQKIS